MYATSVTKNLACYGQGSCKVWSIFVHAVSCRLQRMQYNLAKVMADFIVHYDGIE
jgi:hypothetical protein